MTNEDDIRGVVLSVLTTIAPEVDPEDISDDVLLRDQVDLDSMDWLNFLRRHPQATARRHPGVGLRIAADTGRRRRLRGSERFQSLSREAQGAQRLSEGT